MALSTKKIERALFGVGVALCLVWLAGMAYRFAGSRLAMRSFEAANAPVEAAPPPPPPPRVAEPAPVSDFRLWAAKRVAAYRDALALEFPSPVAVLRAPRIGVEVPVFDGTDELVLNRGVGRIAGTALPGQPGNIGIAGHRDGFFRGLRNIAVGDEVTLDTGAGLTAYVVDEIRIVARNDVAVLAPTSEPVLTLVTCYPFYFIGDAPRRYIVRCVLKENGE